MAARAAGKCCWSKPNLLAQISLILFSLVIAAWTAPLLTANTAYTPQIDNTVGPSGLSAYQLLGPGRATFAAFGYWDEFAILNTTTAVGGGSGASSVQSTSYYSAGGDGFGGVGLDMSCHYTVYSRVTSFSNPWRDGDYRNDAASGTRATLSAPNCRTLTVHRISLICLIVALLPFLAALLSTCYYTRRKADLARFRVRAVERPALNDAMEPEANPPAATTVVLFIDPDLADLPPCPATATAPSRMLLAETGLAVWMLGWGVVATVSLWVWVLGSGVERAEVQGLAYVWPVLLGLVAPMVVAAVVMEWQDARAVQASSWAYEERVADVSIAAGAGGVGGLACISPFHIQRAASDEGLQARLLCS